MARVARRGRTSFIVVMLGVPLCPYAIFVLSPYAQAFYISLTKWSGYTSTKTWVGLGNYRRLMHDSVFWTALRHNALALVLVPVVTIALALFFASLLNVGGRKGRAAVQGVRGASIYRVVYFFPTILSIAVIGVLWSFVYDSTGNGLLNGALKTFGGGGPVDWLGSPDTAFYAILAVMVWVSVGFYVVLFTAGMSSIPRELYEAALIDGAGRWDTFWRLTLPLLWDSIQVSVIFIGIQALDLFALVNVMSSGGGLGGPDNSTQVVSNYLYLSAFTYGEYGYAAAIGVVLFVLMLLLAALTFRLSRRDRVAM
jgi:N-acetylglucosamine transport system permease protein